MAERAHHSVMKNHKLLTLTEQLQRELAHARGNLEFWQGQAFDLDTSQDGPWREGVAKMIALRVAEVDQLELCLRILEA